MRTIKLNTASKTASSGSSGLSISDIDNTYIAGKLLHNTEALDLVGSNICAFEVDFNLYYKIELELNNFAISNNSYFHYGIGTSSHSNASTVYGFERLFTVDGSGGNWNNQEPYTSGSSNSVYGVSGSFIKDKWTFYPAKDGSNMTGKYEHMTGILGGYQGYDMIEHFGYQNNGNNTDAIYVRLGTGTFNAIESAFVVGYLRK